MIRLRIQEDDIEVANDYAEKSLHHTLDRFKLSEQERKEKIMIGKIGERVFARLLSLSEIDFNEDTTSPRRS